MNYKDLADVLYPNLKFTAEELLQKYSKRELPAKAEVTRFAPSPTGKMHLGGLFQTIIDRTLAKNSGGVFILRNEDTDQKRKIEGAAEKIFELMCQFGQKPDEYQQYGESSVGEYGPYIQSERCEIYQAFAKKLVAEGKAFPCFCKKTEGLEEILKDREERYSESSSNVSYDPCRDMKIEEAIERVKRGEKFAIRLRTPNNGNGKVKFFDIKKGEVELPENARDVIIIKNDGIPPYAFAHAIDDTLMGTTLAVRGEEWFSATPEHIDIFNALGFEPIKYYHTPLIWKNDEVTGLKRKISKRKDPEFFAEWFLEKGYPVLAVVEYLLNLINSGFEAWRNKNPNASISEFKFGINDITTVSPLYDVAKFQDVAKNVISRMSATQLYENWYEWSKNYNPELSKKLKEGKEYFIKLCNIDRDKPKPRKDIYCYSMIEGYFSYMFDLPTNSELAEEDKGLYNEFIKAYAKEFKFPQTKEEWFEGVKKVAQSLGYATDNKAYKENPEAYKGNTAKACELLRLCLTGLKNSPDLYEIMMVLGEREVEKRLNLV